MMRRGIQAVLGAGALALGGVGLLTARRLRIRAAYPDPASMILPVPPLPAVVTRQDGGSLRLAWTPPAGAPPGEVNIYASTDPDTIDTIDATDSAAPLVKVSSDAQAVTIDNLDPAERWYFLLAFPSGKRVITAERDVPLQGTINFRDVGGYPTADGRMVRWGKVFRTARLSELTAADFDTLARLDLKLVCDLRTSEERSRDPDRLPDGLEATLTPIIDERTSQLLSVINLLFRPERLEAMICEAYTDIMIDDNATTYGGILRAFAAEGGLPAAVHCSAGKDRTGVAVALLLALLGVPEAYILADYAYTNRYYYPLLATMSDFIKPLARFNVTLDDLYPVFIADPVMLKAALARARMRYGTIENYLRYAGGVDTAAVARLRALLLV